jgi:DNA repair protein RadA/Sms
MRVNEVANLAEALAYAGLMGGKQAPSRPKLTPVK